MTFTRLAALAAEVRKIEDAKGKDPYQLDIHERIYLGKGMHIMKVHGGWLYYHEDTGCGTYVKEGGENGI